MIRPEEHWRWYFDEKLDYLMLELSNDMVFRSRYPSKLLSVNAFNSLPFSVDDVSSFYRFYEGCTLLNFPEPIKVELVLNAIVAYNFLKPQMPKSWYFMQQPMLFTPYLGELIEAQVQDTGQKVNLLAVEVGENASLCLIAEPSIFLAGKEFFIGDVIKLMNDRLIAKEVFIDYGYSAEEEELLAI